MELLKRKIRQALTTGTTESCTGNCRVIIPNPDAVYHVTFLLSSEKHDLGFFDTYVETEEEVENAGNEIPVPELALVNTGTYTGEVSTIVRTIDGNVIITDGNDTITEYGVLYTGDLAYGTAANLIYENATQFVSRSSVLNTPNSTPFTYTRRIGLVDGSTIYYRAFAINSVGISYGLVKSATVIPIIPEGGILPE